MSRQHSRVDVAPNHLRELSAPQRYALAAFKKLARRYVNTRVTTTYRFGNGNDARRDWVELCLFLHKTPIVEVRPNGAVILRTGGWRTVTTKRRINEALRLLGLPCSVYQHQFEWFVSHRREDAPREFEEGETIIHINHDLSIRRS